MKLDLSTEGSRSHQVGFQCACLGKFLRFHVWASMTSMTRPRLLGHVHDSLSNHYFRPIVALQGAVEQTSTRRPR